MNSYAEYRQEINGMSFYTQYEILYVATTPKGKRLVVSPFLADSNEYLPNNIVKLHLGLQTINPTEEVFNIWLDWKVLDYYNGDVILQKSKLVHMSQGLPEEFISIDLPYKTNIHSKIEILVEVISNGRVRYASTAKYKIKEVTN